LFSIPPFSFLPQLHPPSHCPSSTSPFTLLTGQRDNDDDNEECLVIRAPSCVFFLPLTPSATCNFYHYLLLWSMQQPPYLQSKYQKEERVRRVITILARRHISLLQTAPHPPTVPQTQPVSEEDADATSIHLGEGLYFTLNRASY